MDLIFFLFFELKYSKMDVIICITAFVYCLIGVENELAKIVQIPTRFDDQNVTFLIQIFQVIFFFVVLEQKSFYLCIDCRINKELKKNKTMQCCTSFEWQFLSAKQSNDKQICGNLSTCRKCVHYTHILLVMHKWRVNLLFVYL